MGVVWRFGALDLMVGRERGLDGAVGRGVSTVPPVPLAICELWRWWGLCLWRG